MSSQRDQRVAIVGGGITGLTAAYWLQRRWNGEILLIDPRVDGKLRTEYISDLVVDLGPDSIFLGKPGAREFLDELELAHLAIEPQAKGFSIYANGKLNFVPPGLASLGAVSPSAVPRATFLSEEARQAILNPGTVSVKGDISIAEFFQTRYGEEFSRIVAEPLLAGTHAGDPRKLSMQALYPSYLTPSPQASGGPTFVSFKTGIGEMTRYLNLATNRTEHLAATVGAIGKASDGLSIRLDGRRETIRADFVILAIPSNRAAPIIDDLSPEAAQTMREIQHASSVVVTLAFRLTDLNVKPEGTGFLVASGEDCPITGATWTSNKWAGRAPEDTFLVRVYIGRDGGEPVQALTEKQLIDRARLGLKITEGIEAEPTFELVTRWIDALPQYEIGHLGRVARIRESLAGLPITVAGTSYDGVGIGDCMRQGKEAADWVMDRMDQ